MKTKIIITGIIVTLISVTTVKLLSNKRTVEDRVYRPDESRKVLVEADTVHTATFERRFVYTGTFFPNRETMILPQTQGQVRGVFFEEGDNVTQGKLLVQIDDDLLQAQKLSVEATLENARINLNRYEQAALSGGVSGMQVDSWRLTLRTSEAQLKQLNKQISLCRVTAPFTGVITLRDVEPGSVVGGTPIGRISDLHTLKLEISVPETEISLFRKGDSLPITLDATSAELIAVVEYVSPRADDAHNYLVRLKSGNTSGLDLKAGMYATVAMHKGLSAEALAIPRTALLGSAKEPTVFVVRGERAFEVAVTTGQSSQEIIEITAGLSAGDIVVTSGQINLGNNTLVTIVSK